MLGAFSSAIFDTKCGLNAGCRTTSATFGGFAEYTEMVSEAR
jgi:hypothetical protein